LAELILTGEFVLQLHTGDVLLVGLHGDSSTERNPLLNGPTVELGFSLQTLDRAVVEIAYRPLLDRSEKDTGSEPPFI
jgi:hypothetical protein